ncbi:MAG TPA: hypothetical protein VEB40_04505 [Flavipsychrobacter sp.]|nr:hypothetical protein [Flavipsychrobacter sp.]
MKAIKLVTFTLLLASTTFLACGDGSDTETTETDTTALAPADNTGDGISDAPANEQVNMADSTVPAGDTTY